MLGGCVLAYMVAKPLHWNKTYPRPGQHPQRTRVSDMLLSATTGELAEQATCNNHVLLTKYAHSNTGYIHRLIYVYSYSSNASFVI